jgi:hypothetical protein
MAAGQDSEISERAGNKHDISRERLNILNIVDCEALKA